MEQSERLTAAVHNATETIQQAARNLWRACLQEADSHIAFAVGAQGMGATQAAPTIQQGGASRRNRQNSTAGAAVRGIQRTQNQGRQGGARREQLLNLIYQNNGLTRGEILNFMGLKGDKRGEMSVSNALTAITKAKEAKRQSGKYFIANWKPHTGDVVPLQATGTE